MAISASNLLNLQAPGGTLVSSRLRRVTDPISVAPSTDTRLRHFFEGVYDLSPQSHLVRFLKALSGESGVGYLSKVYAYAHSQSVLATMRYADLDAFYGDVLGLKRMSWERTDPALYYTANTPAQWDEIEARDASYRARIEAFSRAIGMGGTPSGLIGVSSALLGAEVRLYESYLAIDETGGIEEGESHPLRPRTWGEVEEAFKRYGTLDSLTYADIEGQYGTIGRADVNDRSHFVIRPMRPISSEEAYQLRVVLDRFKPVGTMLTIDPMGLSIHTPVPMRGVTSDSVHWEVLAHVRPAPVAREHYVIGGQTPTEASFEMPRPAATNKQSEAWSYNADIVNVSGYREIAKRLWSSLDDPDDHELRITAVPGTWTANSTTRGLKVNYQRVHYRRVATAELATRDYLPEYALADQAAILKGRAASDSVALSSPVITHSDLSQQVSPIGGITRNYAVSSLEGAPISV